MIPRKKFGQHFLEPQWADRLVDAIAPRAGDRFLEIGPGPGALTLRLAPRVSEVTAVEIDAGMVADLAPRVPPNVMLVHADVLEFDLASLAGGTPIRVAGNLPYNVSSPILFRLLAAHRAQGGLLDATLMLQREVAERIQAPAGTRDYGVLAILVQLHADVRTLLRLPPGAFRPRTQGALLGDPVDVPSAGGQADGRAAVRVDGSLDVHSAAEDAGECPGGICRRASPVGPRRAGACGHRPRGVARRRCNSQNWRGLRRFSVTND